MITQLWNIFFDSLKSRNNSTDNSDIETQLENIYNRYSQLELTSFTDFTPYMHLCGHLTRLFAAHGNIHRFNCEGNIKFDYIFALMFYILF